VIRALQVQAFSILCIAAACNVDLIFSLSWRKTPFSDMDFVIGLDSEISVFWGYLHIESQKPYIKFYQIWS